MGIEDLFKKEKESIEKECNEKIEYAKEQAKREKDEYAENLNEISRITLTPKNLLEIVEDGGEVKVAKIVGVEQCRVETNRGQLCYSKLNYEQEYRIIVIIEKTKEE